MMANVPPCNQVCPARLPNIALVCFNDLCAGIRVNRWSYIVRTVTMASH